MACDELQGQIDDLTAALRQQTAERREIERELQKAKADLERLAEERQRDLRVQIAERERIERQFIQAQKMEAVGQLTGGISHDFNNLLTIVLGNLDWLRERLTDDKKSAHLAEEAIKAAQRGADLTQRLLTFSRKQDLWPERVDLPDLITRFEPLLTRALRESIVFEKEFEDDLWPVFVDPGQLENAVMNLAINARDAMSDGGTLILRAGNFPADERFAAERTGMAVGDYVVLTIRDTGSGMTQDVLRRACDPFFTTKETSRGSGLGLSMVFGFARQSGGVVEMDSDLGRGTSIHLYLPRAEGKTKGAYDPSPTIKAVGGSEAVLVVEDDPTVRELVIDYLSDLGYQTSNAETALGALGVLESGIEVNLVLTDVVMPGGMSGIDLSDAVSSRYDDVKVLHMSGYSHEEFGQNGRSCEDLAMLRKPFTKDELAAIVRTVLDA